MSLSGKTILITGGLGGIGLGLARHLIDGGAVVIVSHRPGASLDQLPVGASAISLDVTLEHDWAAAIDEVQGALHGLVNMAGFLEPGIPFETMSLAQWRQHMDVNLDGSFLGCRFAMQAMAKTGGGAIVNVSSGAARIMVPEAGAYCVAKSAVLALTRLAAKAGGPLGVRVNVVLPGAIDTPMLWRNLAEGQSALDLIRLLTDQHPIGRIGVPDDIARAISFLLDPGNGFITGALLAVDGGQLL